MKKLTSKSEKLLEEFDEAARDMELQGEIGLSGDYEDAKERYEKTKKALVHRLFYLEQKIRYLQAKNF